METYEIAWLAGLLEGEGHFGLSKHNTCQVDLKMRDEDVVRRAHELVGVGRVYELHPKLSPVAYFHLKIARRLEALEVMQLVRPHMGIRRGARIDEIIEHFKGQPPPKSAGRPRVDSPTRT